MTIAGCGASSGGLGTAVKVPGALNLGSEAGITDISCPEAGSCAASGYFSNRAGEGRAFVVSQRNGVWETAARVAAPAPVTYLNAISCPTADSCAAGGSYRDGHGTGHSEAFVMNEQDGVWGKATRVPGLARFGNAYLLEISCSKAGFCAGAGYYDDRFDNLHPFVLDEVNGVWGKAIEVPGLSALNADGEDLEMSSISCAAPGFCAAGGYYDDGGQEAFVVDEVNRVWGKAIKVPGTVPSDLDLASAWVNSVSCVKPGVCAAGGTFLDYPAPQAFVANEQNGIWHKAIVVPGSAALNLGGIGTSGAEVYSVSCITADSCAAGGSYFDHSKHIQPFVVNERDGVWGKAVKVPGSAGLNVGGDAEVTSISCGKPGFCVAGGHYYDGSHKQHAFLVKESDWVWTKAIEVAGLATLNVGKRQYDAGGADVTAIACAPGGFCAAGGTYTDGSDRKQAFLTAP